MDFKSRLKIILDCLEERLTLEDEERQLAGGQTLGPVEVKIFGQSALLLADLPFPLAGTMDLDALVAGNFWAQKKLGDLLAEEGILLETDSHLIWIPEETQFLPFYETVRLHVFVAEPDAVIASKTKFKRAKDKKIIQTYLEHFPQSADRLNQWQVDWTWVFKK